MLSAIEQGPSNSRVLTNKMKNSGDYGNYSMVPACDN